MGVRFVDDHRRNSRQSWQRKIGGGIEGVRTRQWLFDQGESLNQWSGDRIGGKILQHARKTLKVGALFISIEGELRMVADHRHHDFGDGPKPWGILFRLSTDLQLEPSRVVRFDVLVERLRESVLNPFAWGDLVDPQWVEHPHGVSEFNRLMRRGQGGRAPLLGAGKNAGRFKAQQVLLQRVVQVAAGESACGINQPTFQQGGAKPPHEDVARSWLMSCHQVLMGDVPDVEDRMGTCAAAEFKGKVGGIFGALSQRLGILLGSGLGVLLKPLGHQEVAGSTDRSLVISGFDLDHQFRERNRIENVHPEFERNSGPHGPKDQSGIDDLQVHGDECTALWRAG